MQPHRTPVDWQWPQGNRQPYSLLQSHCAALPHTARPRSVCSHSLTKQPVHVRAETAMLLRLYAAWRSDALRQICEAFILKAYSHCTAAAVTLERVAETLGLTLPGVSGGESAAADASRQCLSLLESLQLSVAAAAPTLREQPSGLASDEQPVVQQQQHQHGAADKRKSVASFTLLTDMPGPNEGPPGGTIRNGSRPLQGESCQVREAASRQKDSDAGNRGYVENSKRPERGGLPLESKRKETRRHSCFSTYLSLSRFMNSPFSLRQVAAPTIYAAFPLPAPSLGLLQEKNAGQVPPPFRCSLLCAAAETLAREEPPPRSPLLLRRGMAELHIGGLSSLLSRWQPAIVCLSKSRLLHFFACAEEEVPIRTFFVGGAEVRICGGGYAVLGGTVKRTGSREGAKMDIQVTEKKRRGFLPRSSLVFRVNGSRECKEWLSVLEMAADDRAFLASAQDINTGHAAPVDACEPPSYASRIVKGTPGDPSATFYSNNSNSAEAYGVQHLMPYPAATGMQHLDVGAHIPSGSMDEVSLDEPPS
ncbi:uncharacterized protein LOC113147513 [Cyclospora cayetanensis]|uniref:Uncharacterized protein LOC113147513 n=1 Tax=Cyclospora cayetanensis TaxID=88456 RepID=A0A6P6S479_9EIME|nr:uncharacterized protein LOC113147513 [Cyclospora cayetanensis]